MIYNNLQNNFITIVNQNNKTIVTLLKLYKLKKCSIKIHDLEESNIIQNKFNSMLYKIH